MWSKRRSRRARSTDQRDVIAHRRPRALIISSTITSSVYLIRASRRGDQRHGLPGSVFERFIAGQSPAKSPQPRARPENICRGPLELIAAAPPGKRDRRITAEEREGDQDRDRAAGRTSRGHERLPVAHLQANAANDRKDLEASGESPRRSADPLGNHRAGTLKVLLRGAASRELGSRERCRDRRSSRTAPGSRI